MILPSRQVKRAKGRKMGMRAMMRTKRHRRMMMMKRRKMSTRSRIMLTTSSTREPPPDREEEENGGNAVVRHLPLSSLHIISSAFTHSFFSSYLSSLVSPLEFEQSPLSHLASINILDKHFSTPRGQSTASQSFTFNDDRNQVVLLVFNDRGFSFTIHGQRDMLLHIRVLYQE